jgi:hypothetical protein
VCVLCGYGLSPWEWADAGPHAGGPSDGSALREVRRARLGRAALCRAVLAPYGLDVRTDAGPAAGFVVSNRKGRSRTAFTLADVWREAEALAARPPDPLDPDLLDALDDA